MTTPATDTAPKFSVAIIGGGIGGLTLAIGLLELGNIDVQIYEAAHEFSEVGLGVNIAPNAQRALSMISPKTHKAFSSVATPNMWESHANNYATVQIGFKGPDEGKIVTRQTNSAGMRSVHRARFLSNLVEHIPLERAHFGKRLVSIDPYDWDQKMTMRFEDGTSAQTDCVVGADGIHSNVRKIITPQDEFWEPKFTGTACYRAIVPMDKASERLGAEYAQNCHLLCGPRAAIFSYPVEHGSLCNIIMMDFDHAEWKASSWIVPADRSEIETILKGWNETTMGIIDLMAENDLSAWAMHDHPVLPRYNDDRVCVTGDAAHATTPFQGQGAGQAIEDSLVLQTLLSNAQNVHQIRFAFHAYDLTRRARTQKVTSTSRHMGHVYGFKAKNIGGNIDKIKQELDVNNQWMWNRDLNDQNEEAMKLFRESMGESG